MAFVVVVHQAEEFEEWLAAEAAPALKTSGNEPLSAAGCLACHSVRGMSEIGRTGPDLTHFASRLTIAAGLRPNTPPELHEWLAYPERLKPDVRMPGYPMLSHVRAGQTGECLKGAQVMAIGKAEAQSHVSRRPGKGHMAGITSRMSTTLSLASGTSWRRSRF